MSRAAIITPITAAATPPQARQQQQQASEATTKPTFAAGRPGAEAKRRPDKPRSAVAVVLPLGAALAYFPAQALLRPSSGPYGGGGGGGGDEDEDEDGGAG
ncbi:hypothetical protein F5X99DRAFT_414422 [Biscogniauxia marginata]|nr:hypothetical protein F5X99DRAFT_414422 [Biscogniauxia marginata]